MMPKSIATKTKTNIKIDKGLFKKCAPTPLSKIASIPTKNVKKNVSDIEILRR